MNIFRANSLKGVIAFGMTMVIICGTDRPFHRFDRRSSWSDCRIDLPGFTGYRGRSQHCLHHWDCNLLDRRRCHRMVPWLFPAQNRHASVHSHHGKFICFAGLAGRLSGGFPIANQFPEWFNQLGGGRIGGQDGIPIPVIVMIIFFLVIWFIMDNTTTGRASYAVGGNLESARLSGINVGKTKIIAFITVQIMAVISGFMLSGQVMSGTYTFGKGWEMDVIAAVVVGGASFDGGVGKVWGTLIGVIFIGVISNGMTLLNFDPYTQFIVKAFIMFLAVLLSSYRAKVKA